MDHRKDFEWLVMDRLGREATDMVEWSEPRLICIAGDFTRYDEHAVKQTNRTSNSSVIVVSTRTEPLPDNWTVT